MLASLRRGAVRTGSLFHNQVRNKHKVVCALYEGGQAGANNPNILGCVENGLGLKDFLKNRGVEFVVTSVKNKF